MLTNIFSAFNVRFFCCPVYADFTVGVCNFLAFWQLTGIINIYLSRQKAASKS